MPCVQLASLAAASFMRTIGGDLGHGVEHNLQGLLTSASRPSAAWSWVLDLKQILVQATAYIYELVDGEIKVDKVEFAKEARHVL